MEVVYSIEDKVECEVKLLEINDVFDELINDFDYV